MNGKQGLLILGGAALALGLIPVVVGTLATFVIVGPAVSSVALTLLGVGVVLLYWGTRP